MLVFFLVQAGKGQEVEWQEVEWQEPGLRRLNGRRFMRRKTRVLLEVVHCIYDNTT